MSIPLLPLVEPVEWISVPAGQVTIEGERFKYVGKGETKTFEVPSFHISKVPISNAQYAQFIDSGGYSKPLWWSQSGWLVKQKEHWQAPEEWEQRSVVPHAPVIGVSWFEAQAFCLWLLAEAKASVMLPTEQQWQRAAENQQSSSRADFSNNISEWCVTTWNRGGKSHSDWNSTALYDEFINDLDDDPFDPIMHVTNFVIRGGNWRGDEGIDIEQHRNRQPQVRSKGLGFRIICQ